MPRTSTNADVYAGKILRQMRVARGLSQPQLSDMVNVTFQQVQKYEKGTNRMTVGMADKVARALNIDPALFFQDNNIEQNDVEGNVGVMKLYACLDAQQRKIIRDLLKAMAACNESTTDMGNSTSEEQQTKGD